MTMAYKTRHRRGQVLIYVVMILIIAIILAIFLFDLQSLIRLRGRTQTSVDASVLTAAAWQGRSLNMIGELNLAKASAVMLVDIDPAESDELQAEKLLAADAMIAEMQTRITYVGPMLGYISAQQAAKKNGLRPNSDFTRAINAHISNVFGDTFGGNTLYEDIYAADIPYNNYDWVEGYRAMLLMLATERLAVKAVNTRYLSGSPVLVGEGAWLLMDPSFYVAVRTHNFCWFVRRGIMESDVYDFSSVRLESNPVAYFPGSEFLSLYVGFQAGPPPLDRMLQFHEERGMIPLDSNQPGLDELKWAVYDNSGNGWSHTANYSFINQYMRTPFREEYTYGGPAARMFSEARPDILTGRWGWQHGKPEAASTSLGEELSWSDQEIAGSGDSFGNYGRRLRRAEQRMAELRESEAVISSAAAKPFGRLDEAVPPQASGLVLPVFDQVRLIPAALVTENLYDRNYQFMEFVLDYFGHPDYPDVPQDIYNKYRSYIIAMERFTDHDSYFHQRWRGFEQWREEYMLGPDGEAGTDDDRRDPCLPHSTGGGGPGSTGGPSILH